MEVEDLDDQMVHSRSSSWAVTAWDCHPDNEESRDEGRRPSSEWLLALGSWLLTCCGLTTRASSCFRRKVSGLLNSSRSSFLVGSDGAFGVDSTVTLNSNGSDPVKPDLPCLRAVRAQFMDLGACDSSSGDISPEALAVSWARAAFANYGRKLRFAEMALIAARTERTFIELDIRRTGRIDVNEWTHCALMARYPPGPAAAAAIADRIRAEHCEHSIPRLLRAWSRADPAATGMVLREVLPQLHLDRASRWELLNAMDADAGSPDLTYAEFCARRLGLQKGRVELYLYDLSKSMAGYLSPFLVGHTEEGIWHSSVVVFGREHYYYSIICTSDAGKTAFGAPSKVLQLGFTLRTEDELEEFLEGLDDDYQPHLYDALEHNCNHLSDAIAFFLLGRHIPNSVRMLSERLKSALIVKALLPILNGKLGGQTESLKSRSRSKLSISGRSVNSIATSGRGARLMSLLQDMGDEVELVLAEVPDCCEPVAAHVLQEYEEGSFDLAWFDDTGHFRVTADVPRVNVRPLRESDANDGFFGLRIYHAALRGMEATSGSHYSRGTSVLTPPEADWRPCCPQGHALRAARQRCFLDCAFRRHCGRCERRIAPADVRLLCHSCKFHLCENCWERHSCGSGSSVSTSASFTAKCKPSLPVGGPDVMCHEGHPMEQLAGQVVCSGLAVCNKCGQRDLGSTAPYFYNCRICSYSLCAACARRLKHRDLHSWWNERVRQAFLASRSLMMGKESSGNS